MGKLKGASTLARFRILFVLTIVFFMTIQLEYQKVEFMIDSLIEFVQNLGEYLTNFNEVGYGLLAFQHMLINFLLLVVAISSLFSKSIRIIGIPLALYTIYWAYLCYFLSDFGWISFDRFLISSLPFLILLFITFYYWWRSFERKLKT
jgi:hypothetical protein